MITKVAEWSSILSFAYLVVASIWSEKFDMNINLIFNIVMFLILIGSLVIFIREKYKGVMKRFDDIAKTLEANSKEFNELKEWVMFKEYDDTTKYTSLDHKIRVLRIKRGT